MKWDQFGEVYVASGPSMPRPSMSKIALRERVCSRCDDERTSRAQPLRRSRDRWIHDAHRQGAYAALARARQTLVLGIECGICLEVRDLEGVDWQLQSLGGTEG